MHCGLWAVLFAGLAATALAQPRHGGTAGPFAVYGAPPALAAGRCDLGADTAPPLSGAFGEPADRACLALVLEYAQDQQWVNWSSGGQNLAVAAMRTYEAQTGYCREFLTFTATGVAPLLRTACRDDGGSWRVEPLLPPQGRFPQG